MDAGLPPTGQTWTKLLLRAWSNYCAEVPRHERNVDSFIKAIPTGQRSGKESPKLTAAASPKLGSVAQASPKVTAQTSPNVTAQASPKVTPAQTSPKTEPTLPTSDSGKNKKGKKRKL